MHSVFPTLFLFLDKEIRVLASSLDSFAFLFILLVFSCFSFSTCAWLLASSTASWTFIFVLYSFSSFTIYRGSLLLTVFAFLLPLPDISSSFLSYRFTPLLFFHYSIFPLHYQLWNCRTIPINLSIHSNICPTYGYFDCFTDLPS